MRKEIDQQLLTRATPIQIWMSMGVEAHLHLYVCVGSQLMPEGYVCSGWLGSLELSLRSVANQAKTGYSARVWPYWTFPDTGGADLIFSLTPVCHNILISQANYTFPCSTYGRSTQSTWSNDMAANLHCVNTKWVIWKRCFACRPCHKTKCVYILNKCPCSMWCSPLHSFPFKKKIPWDAWAIWLWLGPWRNHYPHDPQLLIPSLTPPSVSLISLIL